MSVLKKVGKALKIIILTFVALFMVVLIGFNLYQRISYNEFYHSSSKEFNIPGLSKGFVPQGLVYDSNDKSYLTCGYMDNGSNSRIYSIDAASGDSSFIRLLTQSREQDNCHAGGLCVWNNYLFLATGKEINVYDLSLVQKALSINNNLEVPAKYSFNTGFEPAFCYVKDNYLYVGEFYIAEDYETPKSHHMTTDSGDKHKAIMNVYKLSKDATYGIESDVPVAVYSIRDNAQGVCITDSGKICISTSYGLSTSHIFVYTDPMKENKNGVFKMQVNGKEEEVPLYYLDSAHLEKTWDLPPMAEELEYKDRKVYIMFESASNKYKFGKLSGGSFVYSLEQE